MNIKILISVQALDRSRKDTYIKNNWKIYIKEILMLKGSGGNRPSETIGKFFVSPRGHKKIRIAWHFMLER